MILSIVGNLPADGSTVIKPAVCSSNSALPPFVGSLGIAMLSFSLISSIEEILSEYTPSGAITVFPIESKSVPLSSF